MDIIGVNSHVLEVTVLMPCLNEALTLAVCIEKAQRALLANGLVGEVLIADNGSTDGSVAIAEKLGARVVSVVDRGYGSALMGGIIAAQGEFIIMADADDSYDWSAFMPFVTELRAGAELVMGNRFKGGIHRGAMPFLHRYLGNPVLTAIGRLFFSSNCGDFHCGYRGFNRGAVIGLGLRTSGMEFASEMIIKAHLYGLKIVEIPVELFPDGRDRAPHLRTWRDGWRHLRFMMLFCPRWILFLPGVFFVGLGSFLMLWLWSGPKSIGPVAFDVHTLLYGMGAVLVGVQLLLFSVFSNTISVFGGLVPKTKSVDKVIRFGSLGLGISGGFLLIIIGFILAIYTVSIWSNVGFGQLDSLKTLRLVIPAILLLSLGVQIFLSSVLLSIFEMLKNITPPRT